MRNRFTRAVSALMLAAAAALLSACLEKETHTTIVLQADGSGTWTVLDRDVHARADTAAERAREEQDFLVKVESGRYDRALALQRVGCSEVSSTLVRREWPYAVMTTCRFADVGALWQRILDSAGLHGQSRLEKAGDRVTWELSVQDGPAVEQGDGDDDSVAHLLDGDEQRYLLQQGRFVEAFRFELAQDDRVAVLKLSEDQNRPAGDTMSFRLAWTAMGR